MSTGKPTFCQLVLDISCDKQDILLAKQSENNKNSWITRPNPITELLDLLMNGHKSSVSEILFINQSSVRNCHKMTKCEQCRTKCCAKKQQH